MGNAKMAGVLLVAGFICAVPFSPAYPALNHALFTSLLEAHVKKGLVDYRSLKDDTRLDLYISALSGTDPDTLPKNEQLAFWINVYNALTLRLIRDNYPVQSINKLHPGGSLYASTIFKKTVWHTYTFKINNINYSLNKIEHEILRPVFRDFRIHAAIVCASMSCPALRREAYTGSRINEQLDDQMMLFMANPIKNRYDLENRIFYMSKIFSWFKKDFTAGGRTLLSVLRPYLPGAAAGLVVADEKNIKVKYLTYDWSLNGKKGN